jgi:hypothetical protein
MSLADDTTMPLVTGSKVQPLPPSKECKGRHDYFPFLTKLNVLKEARTFMSKTYLIYKSVQYNIISSQGIQNIPSCDMPLAYRFNTITCYTYKGFGMGSKRAVTSHKH